MDQNNYFKGRGLNSLFNKKWKKMAKFTLNMELLNKNFGLQIKELQDKYNNK